MPTDKKITDLPDASLPIATGVKFEAVQGGVNVKIDADDMPGSGASVPDASPTTKGIAKLYPDVAAQNTDGAPDQNAVFDALALKANTADVPNGLAAVDTTGTAISFAVPQTYGSVASPETGNVTLVTTGLVKGMVQLLLHNHSSAPTFGSEFVKLSGSSNYATGALNSIYMHAISAARIEYTISQSI